jgi:hypothetical protein
MKLLELRYAEKRVNHILKVVKAASCISVNCKEKISQLSKMTNCPLGPDYSSAPPHSTTCIPHFGMFTTAFRLTQIHTLAACKSSVNLPPVSWRNVIKIRPTNLAWSFQIRPIKALGESELSGKNQFSQSFNVHVSPAQRNLFALHGSRDKGVI